jgi:SAM-dependent methyltransferase
MTEEYPEYFARFYDVIYHKVRDSVDHRFFIDRIMQTRGRILEIGTGTGRFFSEAILMGADIYGIDISRAMIEVLKTKIDKSQHFRVSLQNIVDFRFDNKFDLIIAPFRVMMHVTDKSLQMEAINNVCNHLNPGGTFIFDAFVPDLNYLIKGFDNFPDFEGEYLPGKRLKRFVTSDPDFMTQLINIQFRFEWEEEDTVKSRVWNTRLRFFFRYELEHLIERTLFESYRIYGDYNEKELGPDSKEFVVVCRKKI